MNLLLATDHAFLRHHSGVFDAYCFDRGFFDDYRQVFESVEVVCRMSNVEALPAGADHSAGDGVKFSDVPDIRGAAWLLRAGPASESVLGPAVNRADAVVVRVPSQLGWLTAKWARKLGKPYMIEVIGDPKQAYLSSGKGPLYWLVAWLETWRLKQLALYAEAGSYVSGHLQRAYPLSDGRPYDIISSIRLPASEIRTARVFLTPAKPIKIVQVASLTPRKRHKDLIKACRYVVDRDVDVEIHFAGDGLYRKALEMLCQELSVSNYIVFHGHIADKHTLVNLLDESHLFVLTSASEGLPRAILEGMARGLPVVAAQTPGVDELVRSSELYSVGDAQALADLIITLSNDTERLTAMSRHSIKVAKQFTSPVLSPRRVRLYQILWDRIIE